MSAPAGLRNGNHNQYPNRGPTDENANVDEIQEAVEEFRLHRNPNMNPEMQRALQGFSLGVTNAEYSKQGMSIIDESEIPAAELAAAKLAAANLSPMSLEYTRDKYGEFDNFTTLMSIEGSSLPTKDTRFISLGRRKILKKHPEQRAEDVGEKTNEYTDDGSLFKGKAITLPNDVFKTLYGGRIFSGYSFTKLNGTRVIFDPVAKQNGYYMTRVFEQIPSYMLPSYTKITSSILPKSTQKTTRYRPYGGSRRGTRRRTKRSKRSKRATRRR